MKANVLVVEDDKELCSLVALAFELEKFKTYRANNIEKALEILKKNKIDLVFADIVLENKKSTDYRDKILSSNQNVKLILTSAHYDLVENENNLKNSRVIAIAKPYDIEKVIEKAKEICSYH